MPSDDFVWNAEISEHLEQHGISDGRSVFCVFEKLNDATIIPVTAYEVHPRGKQGKPR